MCFSMIYKCVGVMSGLLKVLVRFCRTMANNRSLGDGNLG